jgi:cyclopropane-fatty-acyl-phospholipid synthase
MNGATTKDRRRLQAAREIFEHLAEQLDSRFNVRLWDGSLVPLGREADPAYRITISGPGVLGSILRRPSLETFARHYAAGNIDFEGGDLITLGELAREKRIKIKADKLRKGYLLRRALPLLLAFEDKVELGHEFTEDETGRKAKRDDKRFIQFHYDVSNDFYRLFLDPEMQYSCAYFTDWENSLEQAQHDKLDMICRKLRLQPGERFLDVGCGWGGLLCHAAKTYGVSAHGVTLSQTQYDFTRDKVRRLGLEDRVTLELRSYEELDGEFDKISSIGIYEHVGIANYPTYFGKLHSLLRDRGLLLNHGITRRAKKSRRKFQKIRPEKRLILKYIFPGSELDHIGHSLESMEAQGFEVHDVECWREHYALTCRLWHQRLVANKDHAIAQVGPEKYRMWIAYLAGVSFAFRDGSLRIYQSVASKHKSKGPSGLPPTRADLYEAR